MLDPSLAMELTVWTDAQRAELAAAVVRHLGPSVRILGVGGKRSGPVDQLARQLNCQADDDFRRLLEKPPAFVFLAAATPPTADELAAALPPETIALTLEPVDFPTESSRNRGGEKSLAGRVFHLPAFVRAAGWLNAADPLAAIGPPACLALTHIGPPGSTSLFARLFDAWYTLAMIAPLPENIDASLAHPVILPQRLEDLSGHLCAHARFPGSGCAALAVSDRAAARSRTLLALGPGGQFQVTDSSYDLMDVTGQHLDGHEAKAPNPEFAAQIATDMLGLIDRRAASHAAPNAQLTAAALACCRACWLSCRTGQPESPGQFMKLR